MGRYRKRQNGNIENGEKGELMNEYRMNEEEREKEDGSVRERALIIGVRTQEDTAFDTSMRELESLAEACEMEVAARIEQSLSTPTSAYYIGSGKVKEVQETVELLDIAYVIFEGTLSPSQLKNLQKEIDAQVMDRTNLILEIFSRRARTREARLQVELASLQYMLPRLVGMRENLGRQAGASGSMSNKGTGEKQIELDRRKIEKRISDLGRELEAIASAKGIDISKAAASSGHGSAVPPSARYSTLQDLDAGRHTEIDMFSGALVRMGRELGIPTPYNEYTYHMIKALEEKNDGKFDYSKEDGEVTCSR